MPKKDKDALEMLGLTLREGDYVLIGDNIKVTFDRLKSGGQIYVGVDAPREAPVVRGKIYEANVRASGVDDDPVFAALNAKGGAA